MGRDYARGPKKRRGKSTSKPKLLKAWLIGILLGGLLSWLYLHRGQPWNHHLYTKWLHRLSDFYRDKPQSPQPSLPKVKWEFHRTTPTSTPVKKTTRYELVIATLTNFHATDSLRAKLLLLDLPVKIERLKTEQRKNPQEDLYEITVGPYDNITLAAAHHHRLLAANIESHLRTIKNDLKTP